MALKIDYQGDNRYVVFSEDNTLMGYVTVLDKDRFAFSVRVYIDKNGKSSTKTVSGTNEDTKLAFKAAFRQVMYDIKSNLDKAQQEWDNIKTRDELLYEA